MGHELLLIQNGKKKNITSMIGNLAWSTSIDTLGEELTFDYAYNDSDYFKKFDIINKGDVVALFNNGKVLHHYVVVTEETSGRFGKSYTCFDFAWYLNKNKTIIQFNKVSVSKAIQKLCDKVNIKHNIASMPTLITKIYKEEAVSDIISDLLEQAKQETGSTYRMEMVDQTLTINKQSNLLINPKIRLSDNTPLIEITKTISSPTRTTSIEELKNKVTVVTSEDKSTKIYAEATDSINIKKYGQLAEVITIDSKNAAQARNVAKNTLKELNKVSEEISFDMLGHDDVRAGRLIDVDEQTTGIKDRFLIKSASHTETNGIHRVNVQLERV